MLSEHAHMDDLSPPHPLFYKGVTGTNPTRSAGAFALPSHFPANPQSNVRKDLWTRNLSSSKALGSSIPPGGNCKRWVTGPDSCTPQTLTLLNVPNQRDGSIKVTEHPNKAHSLAPPPTPACLSGISSEGTQIFSSAFFRDSLVPSDQLSASS